MRTPRGAMRHRVEVQAPTVPASQATGSGEIAEAYTAETSRWMALTPLGGQEFVYGQRVAAGADYLFQAAYYSGLTTRHRLKFGTRLFGIVRLQAMPEEKTEEHWIWAKEVT